jgi:hypothetical protein
MKTFEAIWRERVKSSLSQNSERRVLAALESINDLNAIGYTKELISLFRSELSLNSTRNVFCDSACHMPHEYLESIRNHYKETKSIEEAHVQLQRVFKESIKLNKGLTDNEVDKILNEGMGAAGLLNNSIITATKIPSMYREYYSTSEPNLRKSFYCHCPRVRSLLAENKNLDSVYCYCGGGFYRDIWEYITGEDVKIEVIKNLFDGDDVCQFEIRIGE